MAVAVAVAGFKTVFLLEKKVSRTTPEQVEEVVAAEFLVALEDQEVQLSDPKLELRAVLALQVGPPVEVEVDRQDQQAHFLEGAAAMLEVEVATAQVQVDSDLDNQQVHPEHQGLPAPMELRAVLYLGTLS